MAELTPMELHNLRVGFRTAMWMNVRESGETVTALSARLKQDPATSKIAKQLLCTVDELLTGLGTPEHFQAPEGYDPVAAEAEVREAVDRIARKQNAQHVLGSSGRDEAGKQMGVLAAPKAGERQGKIESQDPVAAQALREKMDELRGVKRAPAKGKPGKPGSKAGKAKPTSSTRR